MALTGTFLADFSAIGVEAQRAETALAGLTGTSDKAGAALAAMAGRFNGAQVITEATLMADVFERAGGSAKFTSAELAAMSRTGAEAAEKMRALGLEVPLAIQRIADATKNVGDASAGATPHVGTLHTAMNQFDGVLAALGLHIGPEVRGLAELGEASGKSASEIGLLGVGGLALGAAIGGWKIGRAVADFFDLDHTIGNATATLLGWGDVAAQVAGAKADVLAEASRRIGFDVVSLTTALEINALAQKDWRTNATVSADVVARWQEQIAKVQAAGDLPSLTADLKSQNFTLQDLATRYGLTVEALHFLTRETKAAADAEKESSAAIQASNQIKLKALADEIGANRDARAAEAKGLLETTRLWDEYFTLREQHGGTANTIAMAQIERWGADLTAKMSKAGTDTNAFYDALAAVSKEKMDAVGIDWSVWKTRSISSLQELADNAWKTYNAMIASGDFFRADLDKQLAKYHQLNDAARGYGDAGVDAANRILAAEKKKNDELEKAKKLVEDLAAANRAMGNSTQYDFSTQSGRDAVDPKIATWLHDGYSLAQASAIAFDLAWGIPINPNDPLFRTKGPRVPGFADGGTVMVGEQGPEVVRLPLGSTVFPTGTGGGVTFMPGSIVIQGSVVAERELAGRLSATITTAVLRGIQVH
jgi:hypothetical protein